MFYQNMAHNKNRIKTQQKLPDEQIDFPQHRVKLKIKNIRFSLEQEIHKINHNTITGKNTHLTHFYEENPVNQMYIGGVPQTTSNSSHSNNLSNMKRANYFNKLPGLNRQTQQKVQFYRPVLPKHQKKQTHLRSLMQKMRPSKLQTEQPQPTTYNQTNSRVDTMLRQHKKLREWKLQSSTDFINEFSQQNVRIIPSKTTKPRPPKILQNQMIKFKNNNNVIRRKIFSQDKNRHGYAQRQKESIETMKDSMYGNSIKESRGFPFRDSSVYMFKDDKQSENSHKEEEGGSKNQIDLDGIQIITFSNKFPGVWKD